MPGRVLIVDDEPEMGNFFKFFLEGKDCQVVVVENGQQAEKAMQEHFHLVLLDLKLPDTDGLTLLRQFKTKHPRSEVVIMTGYSTVKSAVEAIQLGAFDYIEKPFDDLGELEQVIDHALSRALARKEESNDEVFNRQREVFNRLGYVIGGSLQMHRLLMLAERLAQKNITLLIRGETGTGKEVLARYIHAVSNRAQQPFLAINCGALPPSLLESELFGHEKGAFTGATERHRGIFELAHKGILFLDEIGEASQEIQVKLLRVLETGEIFRVGAERPLRIDTRVIAATNAPLEEMVKQKRFRADLFYRLDVVTLTIPPLRERPEDIRPLAEHFLARHYQDGSAPQLSEAALSALEHYPWPGNIRELANAMAQVAAICDQEIVSLEDLPGKVLTKFEEQGASGEETPPEVAEIPERKWLEQMSVFFDDLQSQIDFSTGFNLPRFLDEMKRIEVGAVRSLIGRALKESGQRYPRAAKLLHTTPRVLRYLIKEKNC